MTLAENIFYMQEKGPSKYLPTSMSALLCTSNCCGPHTLTISELRLLIVTIFSPFNIMVYGNRNLCFQFIGLVQEAENADYNGEILYFGV